MISITTIEELSAICFGQILLVYVAQQFKHGRRRKAAKNQLLRHGIKIYLDFSQIYYIRIFS